MNSSKKIRHLQSLLYTSGMGIILFSLWSGIRDVEFFFEELRGILHTVYLENPILSEKTIYVFLGVIFFGFVACMILLHIYIGRNAVLFSIGRIKNNRYVIWAIIDLCASFYSYAFDWQSVAWKELIRPDRLVLFIIDITSNIILVEIVVFSIILKRMRN